MVGGADMIGWTVGSFLVVADAYVWMLALAGFAG
jgi:hypothetical protein